VELIDSHCHLDFYQFDADRPDVWRRAEAIGVRQIVNPGTDLESSRRAVALAQWRPGIFAAVGVHPNDAADFSADTVTELTALAKSPGVVAIGEIGLDYYRDRTPKAQQVRALEAQLTLARQVNLPVIIHQREAQADTMAILRHWAGDGPHAGLVLHAFSGDATLVNEAASLGFFMGIGGPITFKNAQNLADVAAHIPAERLLIETDAPFLSPHPFRGKRNEPARVMLVAQKLAQVLNIPLEAVARQTTVNARALFALPAPTGADNYIEQPTAE